MLSLASTPALASRQKQTTPTRSAKSSAQKTRTQKLILKSPLRLTATKAAYDELFAELYTGHAAAMYVIPHKGVVETVLKSPGAYGSGQSQEVKVTGLGASGIYNAEFLGSVSTHNDGAQFVGNKKAMQAFIDKFAASGGVTIAHTAPNGTVREIVTNHPAAGVTQISIAVPLKPGKNVIEYRRTDRASGRSVGAQSGYGEWRSKIIYWDGK